MVPLLVKYVTWKKQILLIQMSQLMIGLYLLNPEHVQKIINQTCNIPNILSRLRPAYPLHIFRKHTLSFGRQNCLKEDLLYNEGLSNSRALLKLKNRMVIWCTFIPL